MRTSVLVSITVLAALNSIGCYAFAAFSSRTNSKFDGRVSTPVHIRGHYYISTSKLHMGPVEAWESYNNALEANPLLVKSVTACFILGSADLAGQAIEAKLKDEGESDIDIMRTVRFAIFGLVLQAPWNHYFYQILDGALPPTEDPWTPTTAVKVVIDQFVQAPIFTSLIFVFLGTLEGKQFGEIKKQLDEDYVDTMIANWKLFVPATVVNLAFIPPIFRVLYLNVVFFFWSIYLSLKINKGGGEDLTK